jgi:hypothetical protein
VVDATNQFVSHFADIFHASEKEVHTFGLHGDGTGAATGVHYRFDAVLQVVLDSNGSMKVGVVKVVCR